MEDTSKDPIYRAYGGDPDAKLAAWHEVYEGLSDEEIAEVEAIALRRNGFFRGDAG